MVFILYKLYVLLPYTYPTPKLSPQRRRCISTFPQITLSVWFISILNYGDTENVLINHLLLVICHTHVIIQICVLINHINMHTHTHTHTHTHISEMVQLTHPRAKALFNAATRLLLWISFLLLFFIIFINNYFYYFINTLLIPIMLTFMCLFFRSGSHVATVAGLCWDGSSLRL